MRNLATLIAAIALLPAACLGWGREGHRIIAALTEDLGVWDTSLIQHTGLKRREYAKRLEALITSEQLELQNGGTAEQWANESVALVKTAQVRDGADLDESYHQREIGD